MALRPPSITRRPVATSSAPSERVRRPIPTREAPRRSTSPVETAYRVYDEYVDDGRRYAEGQSAWFNDAQRDPNERRATDPRVLLDLWSALTRAWSSVSPQAVPAASIGRIAAQITALLDQLTSLGGPPPRDGGAPHPVPLARDDPRDGRSGSGWRRWFDRDDDELSVAPGGIDDPDLRPGGAGGALRATEDAPGKIEPEDLEPRTHAPGSTKRGH